MKKYAILLICFSLSLNAYKTWGTRWESRNVTISPDLGTFVNAAVADCKYTWNNAIWYGPYFCEFEFQYSNYPPYNMFWEWSEDPWLGYCDIRPWPPQTVYWDAVDFYFNSNPAINWCYDGTPNSTQFDFKTMCKHEMGHGASLAHCPGGIMEAGLAPGEVNHISYDDVTGIACLYGTYWKKKKKDSPCHYEVYLESSGCEEEPGSFHRCTTHVHIACCEGGSNPSHTVKLFITYDNGASWERIWERNSVGIHRRIKVYFNKTSANTQIKAKWFDNGTPFAEDTTRSFIAYYRPLACPPIPIEGSGSVSLEEESYTYSSIMKSKIKNNSIYSIYDKLGRALMRHKKGSVIKEYINTKKPGIYFLRKEFPGKMQVKKLIVVK